ncbi:carbohydrate kinase family protein [Nocardia sp. NPDC052001]|uniref:carbohydrate kinase family protein n=1 Tax=Nocardia sp. NPDC052001 TaxID=3154853 RepID=UPI00343E6878
MTRNNPQRRTDSESAPQDLVMVAVRGILTRLRTRSGLNADRLASTEIDATVLFELSVVRRYIHLSRSYARLRSQSREVALPKVVGHIARRLPPTQRLIVDAELVLGLFGEHPPDGLDLAQLYGPDLGERRGYLIQEWYALHGALDVLEPPSAPSVRALRDAPEEQAFTALAELLTMGSDLDVVGMVKADAGHDESEVTRATVTILGDAAIDQINVVEAMPEFGASAWGDFRRHPGGKGLNRAVALARLGLDSRLIAAIGADGDGRTIEDYLEREGVDTSLLKVIAGARTPIATVIALLTGESTSIAFRQGRLALTAVDLSSTAIREALTGSDATVVTFEQPIDVVAQVMAIVELATPRPWLVVSASPPTVLPGHLHRHLGSVDYLVGNSEEIASTWPGSTCVDSTDRLLRRGVGAVCIVDGSGCTVRTMNDELRVAHPRSRDSSAGSSSAFSAALIYRLTMMKRPAENVDFQWATAAISARDPVLDIPESMPSVSEIDSYFDSGNLNGLNVIGEEPGRPNRN